MENTSLWLGFKIRKEASYPEAEGGCVTQKTFESSSPHFTLSVTIAPENKSDVPVKILTGNVSRISNKKSNYLISPNYLQESTMSFIRVVHSFHKNDRSDISANLVHMDWKFNVDLC